MRSITVFILMMLTSITMTTASSSSSSVIVIDLRNQSQPIVFAVQVCVGLYNRHAPAAYTIMDKVGHQPYSTDEEWLGMLKITNRTDMSVPAFLTACMTSTHVRGYIRYNFTHQMVVVPNIVTLAAVLDAVPLEDGSPYSRGATLVFDAIETFASTPLAVDVTAYVFDHYGQQTTTMAMMNPGYDNHHGHDFNPPLTGTPDLGLVDYIVKRRLFNFYLNDGCIPLTAEHKLLERMIADSDAFWPKPIPVFGYNEAWYVLGGDFFETETLCSHTRSMGCVGSDGCNNLAYFSSHASPITKPMKQNPEPKVVYNASRTYATLIVGDGDNIRYIKTTRMHWMKQRAAKCANDPSHRHCFPLMWTMSGHALYLAPEWIEWFYNQSYTTGTDYFMMPPMGYLASYPSLMPPHLQNVSIELLEVQANIMQSASVVSWEWMTTWPDAFKNYYPRFAFDGVIRGVFTVNVPFMIPILEFGDDYYKILTNETTGHDVVMFRPREWRGTNTTGMPPLSGLEYLTAPEMAAEFNRYPTGTLTNIYLTDDGGIQLQSFFDFVDNLDEHVQIVSANTLVDLVHQKELYEARNK